MTLAVIQPPNVHTSTYGNETVSNRRSQPSRSPHMYTLSPTRKRQRHCLIDTLSRQPSHVHTFTYKTETKTVTHRRSWPSDRLHMHILLPTRKSPSPKDDTVRQNRLYILSPVFELILSQPFALVLTRKYLRHGLSRV
jgi:hypothetical protein